jgi:peptidoglycan-associated lipoprotein
MARIFRDGAGRAFANHAAEQAAFPDRVYFDLGSSEIREDALPALEQQARWLLRNPATRVVVEGYADARGSRAYNSSLGAQRAEAVRARLAELGVPRERMDTISFGKDRPVDLGTSDEAYQENRSARSVIVKNCDERVSSKEDFPCKR